MTIEEFQVVIDFAIEKEEEAASLYQTAEEVATTPDAKKTFKEFAAEEKKHKELLQGLDARDVKESEVADVPNLKISDYLVDVEFKPDMNYQDMLILAMKREEQSHRLYTGMVTQTGDPQLKKLFQMLAQEEAKHKLKLETIYDEKILKDN